MFTGDFTIQADKLALVIIDMQNYLVDKECGLARVIHRALPEQARYYFERVAGEVIPNNVRLIEYFRGNNLLIIYVTIGSARKDGRDFLGLRKADFQIAGETFSTIPVLGTYEHEIIPEIRPREGEMVLNKTTRSAFTSTGIDQILRNMGIDTLAFTGGITNVCVETTARDAADRGYKTILIEDACAAVDRESQELTMRNYGMIFGRVMTAGALIKELNPERVTR